METPQSVTARARKDGFRRKTLIHEGTTSIGHCSRSKGRISTEKPDAGRNNLNRSLIALARTDYHGKPRLGKEQPQLVTARARRDGFRRKTLIQRGTTSIGHCSCSQRRISTENRDSGRNNLNRSMFALAGTDFNGEPRFGEEQPQSHTVLARTDGFRLKTLIQGGKTSIGHCSRSQERISTQSLVQEGTTSIAHCSRTVPLNPKSNPLNP